MDAGGEVADEAPAGGSPRRRLALAGGAAALLAALVAVAALSASSGSPAGDDPEDCVAAWNSSRAAVGDGLHAREAHGYEATLVTRVDDAGELLEPGAEDGRCAVVFAAREVDFEPDFGVRVYSSGAWNGLFYTDAVPLDEIERMQQEALESANATLERDGTLSAAG